MYDFKVLTKCLQLNPKGIESIKYIADRNKTYNFTKVNKN